MSEREREKAWKCEASQRNWTNTLKESGEDRREKEKQKCCEKGKKRKKTKEKGLSEDQREVRILLAGNEVKQ